MEWFIDECDNSPQQAFTSSKLAVEQETRGFLMHAGGAERDQWHKMV